MNKITKWLAISCAATMLLAGCGIKNAPVAEPSPSSQPSMVEIPEPTVTPIPAAHPYTAPLTGIGGEEEFNHRPIAVIINNLAPARPQSGLTEADVVWEVLAEGGITRLLAIFQSTKEAEVDVGPVRSNRPYLIDLADSYQAIIAHAGASNDAYAILQRQAKPYLDEIKNAGPYYWRSKERKAPHNLYTNLSKLREGAEKRKYELTPALKGYAFQEASEQPTIGSIQEVEITFQLKNYKISYEYDQTANHYGRLINGAPHIDKNNEQQLYTNNIVVMQTDHKVLDNEGRLAINLKDGGAALLISEGKVTEGKWVRAEDGMIRFMQGTEEMKLSTGKTFIHIVPTGKAITEHVVWE